MTTSKSTRRGYRFNDYTGKRFGRLFVEELSHRDEHRIIHWKCKCDCGAVVVVRRDRLHPDAACGPCLRGAKKYPTVEKSCERCGGKFLARRGRYFASAGIKPFSARFCSRACSTRAHYKPAEGVVKDFSETEAAYLAAFIDGEGSILKMPRSGGFSYRVTIVNTHEGSLKWVAEVTGAGGISVKSRGGRYKPAWTWSAHAQAARLILERCLPYLIIKKDKAELVIADLKAIVAAGIPRIVD